MNRILIGRELELYSGNCPPERPCTPEQVARYRNYYDGAPVPPSPGVNPHPERCRHHGPTVRDEYGKAKTVPP